MNTLRRSGQRAVAPEPNAARGAASKRRLYAALVVLLALAAVAYARFRGQESPALPQIPEVNLEGTDPRIAMVVRNARLAVVMNPRIAATWGYFAMVLHAHGFSDSAQIGYEAAGLLEPNNPQWPYLRGRLHQRGPGGPEAALPALRQAASLSPPNSSAHVAVAESLLDIGHLEEAEVEYRRMLALNDAEPFALLGLAKVAVAQRRYRDALEHLLAVADSPQVQKESCVMRARLYDRLGDRDAAARDRRRWAELPEDQLRADDALSEVYRLEIGVSADVAWASQLLRENRVEEAMGVLTEATQRYPDSLEVWTAFANACGRSGNPAGAERAARRCTELAPENARSWLSLANVQLWEKRPSQALSALEKSLELNPEDPEAHLSLGVCRRELGDIPGAAEAFRETLRLAPNHPKARQRLEQLRAAP